MQIKRWHNSKLNVFVNFILVMVFSKQALKLGKFGDGCPLGCSGVQPATSQL
jgi:hypothetical protein